MQDNERKYRIRRESLLVPTVDSIYIDLTTGVGCPFPNSLVVGIRRRGTGGLVILDIADGRYDLKSIRLDIDIENYIVFIIRPLGIPSTSQSAIWLSGTCWVSVTMAIPGTTVVNDCTRLRSQVWPACSISLGPAFRKIHAPASKMVKWLTLRVVVFATVSISRCVASPFQAPLLSW